MIPTLDTIYKHRPHRSNRRWIRINPNCVQRRYHIDHTLEEVTIPSAVSHCTVWKTPGLDRLRLLDTDRSHQYDEVEVAPGILQFHQHLENLPEDAKWAISHTQCPDGGLSVANAIRQGTLRAVGDGSFKGGFGTSAFTLEEPNHCQQRI